MIIDIPTVEGGEFIDGGPNTLGTIVTAAFLNAVMKSSTSTTKEIQTVLIKAGIDPNAAAFDQLYKAIDFMMTSQLNTQPISNGYLPTRQYRSGELVFVDGIWHECYHPDGCKGKDPRDPKNRPLGWTNQDIHAPYYWVAIGRWLMLDEIGVPLAIPSIGIREGLILYKNDTQLSAKKFWRLAELYPNLVKNGMIELADMRAMAIRFLDNGRGIDVDRQLLSYQEDAMQKMTGTAGNIFTSNVGLQNITGVFSGSYSSNYIKMYLEDSDTGHGTSLINFENTMYRTANEERIKTIAFNSCLRF